MSKIDFHSMRVASHRDALAEQVRSLAIAHGATFEMKKGDSYPGPRCLAIELSFEGGLQLSLLLDGSASNPDVFVLPWHMSVESENRLSPQVFFEVNRCHGRKCTEVASDVEALLDRLTEVCEAASLGRLYESRS